MPEAHLMTLT